MLGATTTTTTATSSTASMVLKDDDNQSLGSASSDVSLYENEIFSPRQCLFCNSELDSLDANLSHMSHTHNFFIPNASHLVDTETFLDYLSKIISDFNECLFCQSVRGSKAGVQDHMRGKGHCRLDFEGFEEEYEGFYDSEDDEEDFEEEEENLGGEMVVISSDEDELRLPSGKILANRSSRPHRSRQPHSTRPHSQSPAQTSSNSPSRPSQELGLSLNNNVNTASSTSNERRIIARPGTSTSMIGVPQLQQRALRATEKKIELVQTKARNQYQAKVERGGNKQKTFRVCSIGKKAGGLEKRLG